MKRSTTGVVRNIDELGRLVVPKEMRTTLGIDYSDPVEISIEEDKIVIRKHAPYCIFCQSTEGLSEFKGKKICKECLSEMTK